MTKQKKATPAKVPTGISGLDEITGGGLPRGRTTLVMGGPGCGKTILGLQTLVHGARHEGEPGILVAFEERARDIVANAATFGWNLPELVRKKLFILDVHLKPEVVENGDFDLQGLLAGITVKAKEIGAKRIVFDAIDVLLARLDNPRAERRELARLQEWLQESGLTGVITAKAEGNDPLHMSRYGYLQFMTDCTIVLATRLVDHVCLRNLRVVKYRGSAFAENEAPLVIGPEGIEVANLSARELTYPVSNERVSTGVKRLDTMLHGGYFRGAGILIAGAPGTAKTTLSGAFLAAACRRKERALYVSFDENAAEIQRNLLSVNIHLQSHVKTGLLRMVSTRSEAISAKEHLVKLKLLIRDHQPRCIVIDPLSALLKAGGPVAAHGVVERLLHLIKCAGITAIFTSLIEGPYPSTESSLIQISTVADTWIQLSYAIQAGERNRALTVIKSRGTNHSNQVRELLLTDGGVSLADVYASGGEVLMGTLRWEREQEAKAADARARLEADRKRHEIELARAALRARIQTSQYELNMKELELEALGQDETCRTAESEAWRKSLRLKRSADHELRMAR